MRTEEDYHDAKTMMFWFGVLTGMVGLFMFMLLLAWHWDL